MRMHIELDGRVWRRASLVFLAAGAVLLTYWVYVDIQARLYQASETLRFESKPPASPSLMRSAIRRGIEKAVRLETRRAPATSRIEIPRIGLSSVVVEGVDSSNLTIAVGHVPGTALPGENGNVALAGHRDTFFRKLREIRRGDAITLTTPKASYRYSVELVEVVEPSYLQALQASSYPKLTLITCYPFSFIGPAPRRFVVQARQIE